MSKIVVVGSLHYDIMLDAPHRPEKGETVMGTACRYKFGGKGGNQALAAARAGAEVYFIGAVGADEPGRFLLSALQAGGVNIDGVQVVDGIASGMSVAISDAEGDYGRWWYRGLTSISRQTRCAANRCGATPRC